MSYSQPHYTPFLLILLIVLIPYLSMSLLIMLQCIPAFIGGLSQILQAADMYYARIREIDLQSNSQESIIYIPNKDPSYSAPHAMNTPRGTKIPRPSDGRKNLGCSNRKNTIWGNQFAGTSFLR